MSSTLIFPIESTWKSLSVTVRNTKIDYIPSITPSLDLYCTPSQCMTMQLIKAFYRKIPCDEPGFLPPALLSAKTEREIVDGFATLSEPRKSLLLWTFDLWIGIEDMKSFNKMTLQSMSIVFSPNMVRCSSANPMVFLELQKQIQNVTLDASKLRRQKRLVTPSRGTEEEMVLVPFRADRSLKEESPEMRYPSISESTDCNTSGIGAFFKSCVIL